MDALGLERAALYRLLPGGEIVPVVACGQEPPLEHVGGSVARLEERALSKRAFDGKDVVVVRGSGEDPILPKEGYEAAGRTVVVGPMFGHDTLLDLSRLEVDAIGLRRQEIEVKPLVESIVSNIADEVAEQITVEVVVNPLKYGAPPVTITAEQRDTHFRLAVEDRGSGIGKDFVPRLFERFARADGRRKDGDGLGLAIAPSYANAHGGELIYGDAEPSGARFELVLPRPHGDT